jgi:integrase
MKYSLKPTIRKDQKNSQGECPIYIRYIYNRKFINFPLSESIPEDKWDSESDLPKSSLKNFRVVYEKIISTMDSLEKKINEFNKQYSRIPSCQELKEFNSLKSSKQSKNDESDSGKLFTKVFNDFIELRKKELRKSTITIYFSTLKKWEEFEKSNKRKYFLNDINGKLFQDFRLYVLNSGKQLSTTGKYVKTIKTFVNTYLIDYLNMNVDITFKKVKVDKEEKNTFEVLNEMELENLKEAVFYSRYKVKDSVKRVDFNEFEKNIGKMFLFMCNTGLAYVDLLKLSYADIHIEDEKIIELNNEEVIQKFVYVKIERTKTTHKSECIIPIVGTTIDLLISQIGLPVEDMGAGNLFLNDQDKIQILIPRLQNVKNTFDSLSNKDKYVFPKIFSSKFNEEIKQVLCRLEINEPVPKIFRGKDRITEYVPKYKKISAHSGRRTYITLCLRQGVLPDVLMQSTGHKKFDTMTSYHKHDAVSVNKEIRKKVKN